MSDRYPPPPPALPHPHPWRAVARVIIMVVVVGGCLGAGVSPALGFRGHVFADGFGWGVSDGNAEPERCSPVCSRGLAGAGDGQFSEPEGVAVNEASGDVYVVDRANNRVEQFTAAGVFLAAWGWHVSEGGSEEYEVCVSPSKCQAGSAGSGLGQLQQAKSIAVDNTCALHELKDPTHKKLSSGECETLDPSNGDVYVETGLFGNELIEKFTATGTPLTQITGPGPGETGNFNEGGEGGVEGIAVDPNGELWALVRASTGEGADNFNDKPVNEFIAFRSAIPGGAFDNHGFAVDAEDNLYARGAGQNTVFEFNADGRLVNRVVGEEPGEVGYNGVAVEASSGDSYVDDLTSVARRGAFQGAGANPLEEPAGNPLIERFGEEVLQGQLHLGACETFGAGGEASCRGGVVVSSVSGRVYVVVGSGDEVLEFVLEPPAVPGVVGESVVGVSSSSVSFQASVNPRSDPGEEPTSYWFEYVSEEQFAREGFAGAPRTVVGSLAPVYEASVVSAHAQGLTAGTTYRYRVVAENHESRRKKEPVEGERDSNGEEVPRTFTTQTPGGLLLPDERAWELVSPPVKLGALLLPIRTEFAIQAAAGGGAFTYVASAPTENAALGNTGYTQVLSWRGAGGGWGSRDLSIPHEQAVALTEHPEYPLFSEDLSLAGVQPLGGLIACTAEGQPCLSGEASEQSAFLRSNFPAGSAGAMPCSDFSCIRRTS